MATLFKKLYMANIKQKILKFILSFAALVILSSCESFNTGGKQKSAHSDANDLVKIAILLPLSGPEGNLGMEYNKAIKMGLSDAAKTKIQVTSYDAVNEKTLEESLEKLLENKTDLIIGPIFSEPTKKVINKTAKAEIPIITLSNNPVLADKKIFVFGHAPMRQLEYMVNYLLENQYQNYVILFPRGHHYETVGKILQDMIKAKGGDLAKIEFYTDLDEDLERAIKVISDTIDNINEMDDNFKKPVLLIADDSQSLEKVFTFIQRYNIDKTAVIAGDNRLNIDIVGNIDIMYTGSRNMMSNNLAVKAEKAGIKHMTFMHALAYDAGKIVGDYIDKDYNKNSFLNKLNTNSSFVGISGRIHFTDSIAQRGYDILKRQSGKYIDIVESERVTP
jgi:ABC-type branched-subunit amino acid transport system substrate-binding protein